MVLSNMSILDGYDHNYTEEILSSISFNFTNKVILITGSGRGIGREIAIFFAKCGADVVVNFFRNREPAEATAEEIRKLGRRAVVVRANLGEMDQIDTLFDAVRDTFGYIDYFVHNAASGYNRPVMEQRPKGWDWTMDINARSFLFASQRAFDMMKPRNGGAIVAISSPGAQRVLPDYVVVGASKAAIEAITRYLAVEFAPFNISVNAVSPGVVKTDALQHFNTIREDQDIFENVIASTPAGRLASPNDVAQLVAFLCSPAAQMIRGQVITMDGGYTLPVEGIQYK